MSPCRLGGRGKKNRYLPLCSYASEIVFRTRGKKKKCNFFVNQQVPIPQRKKFQTILQRGRRRPVDFNEFFRVFQ